jgi:hypothetical protein
MTVEFGEELYFGNKNNLPTREVTTTKILGPKYNECRAGG